MITIHHNIRNIGIIILGLLIFILIMQVVSADTYTVTLDGDYVTEDGHIYLANTRDNTSSYMLSRYENGDKYRAYVEWDLSPIPPQATLLNVSLYYHIISTYSDGNHEIYSMFWQPSEATDLQVWNDCDNGTIYESKDNQIPGARMINTSLSQWDISPMQDIEDNLTRGWWALGWDSDVGSWAGIKIATAEADPDIYYLPTLWIEYEINAPRIANESPAHESTEVNLTPRTCIDISHDYGTDMNITWYYWNASAGAYEEYGTNGTGGDGHTLGNGTYCQNASWATEPCTTYYWYVDVADEFGNITTAYYQFKTHCILSPSGVTCTRINATAINLTFTKKPDNAGETHTVIYYEHGAFPPNWGGGTFGGNTTNEWIVINNLEEGQCYAFSLWTNWNSSVGVWYLSDDATTKGCCASGGDYRVCFFNEETEQPIDFSTYPHNLSTHLLRIHYYDNTEDDYFIKGDNASNDIWYTGVVNVTLYDCGGDTCGNISATQEIWYVELIIFYDFNNSGLWTDQNSYCTYSRKLTTNALQERNCSGVVLETFYFFIADLTTYGCYYNYYNGTTLTVTQDADYQNSLVGYEYVFSLDASGQIISADPNTAWITIYEPEFGAYEKIIHEEFIDVARVINPFLIYDKDYLMGAHTDDYDIYNFGIAPTSTNLQPQVIIRTEFETDYIFDTVDLDFDRHPTWIYITYSDPDLLTEDITVNVLDEDQVVAWTSTKFTSTCTFNATPLDNDTDYVIMIWINRTTLINNIPYLYSGSMAFFVSALLDIPIISATDIDNFFEPYFGVIPIPELDWALIITFGIAIVVFSFLFGLGSYATGEIDPKVAGASSAITGFTMVAVNSYISGLNGIVMASASALIILGILAIIVGVRRE